jgi:hypothetical protein
MLEFFGSLQGLVPLPKRSIPFTWLSKSLTISPAAEQQHFHFLLKNNLLLLFIQNADDQPRLFSIIFFLQIVLYARQK